jgi:Na+/phosphate symporter
MASQAGPDSFTHGLLFGSPESLKGATEPWLHSLAGHVFFSCFTKGPLCGAPLGWSSALSHGTLLGEF